MKWLMSYRLLFLMVQISLHFSVLQSVAEDGLSGRGFEVTRLNTYTTVLIVCTIYIYIDSSSLMIKLFNKY